MKTFVLILFVLVVLATAFCFLLRPVLRRVSALAPMWENVDRYELSAWDKLTQALQGLKTKLVAAFVTLSGALVGLHDQILPLLAGVDITPLTSLVPAWAWPLILIGLGWLFSKLRDVTFGPPAKV